MLDSSGSGCHDETHRIWSLWDIMNYFEAHKLCTAVEQISAFSMALGISKGTTASMHKAAKKLIGAQGDAPSMPIDSGLAEIALRFLSEAKTACGNTAMEEAKQKVAFVLRRIRPDGSSHDYSSLQVELDHAKEAIVSSLKQRTFLYVAPDRSDYLGDELFGASVSENFSSAREDIHEAGNCIAAGM
jgi:hypothetical protein